MFNNQSEMISILFILYIDIVCIVMISSKEVLSTKDTQKTCHYYGIFFIKKDVFFFVHKYVYLYDTISMALFWAKNNAFLSGP